MEKTQNSFDQLTCPHCQKVLYEAGSKEITFAGRCSFCNKPVRFDIESMAYAPPMVEGGKP